jgi:TRAP-type C4-dicarboxylate transport system permease small subunit
MEWLALGIGSALALWIAWYMLRMAWDSWVMNELSSGLIALPMWLPQGAMAWGAVAFALALLELFPLLAAGADLPGPGDAEEFSADR